MENKLIDFEKIIKDKNPTLLKRLPKFVINYLKRVIHQKEVNQILSDYGHLQNEDFCEAMIQYYNMETSSIGLENVPKTGGIILAANHPIGGMDFIALVNEFTHHRKDHKFIVNDILLDLKNLRGIFTGVNKHGANATASLRKVDELFGSGQAVAVFPAGLVSRRGKGKIKDLEWKKTFVSRAKKYNTPIIPVYIDGRLSTFFYRLANLRERIGIKANIEMLYLVDEQFKQRNKKISIKFGKPVLPEHLDKSKTDKEWAQYIKEEVYKMA